MFGVYPTFVPRFDKSPDMADMTSDVSILATSRAVNPKSADNISAFYLVRLCAASCELATNLPGIELELELSDLILFYYEPQFLPDFLGLKSQGKISQ